MKTKSIINTTSRHFYNKSLGLLLVRVGLGLLFLSHGWMKIQNLDQVATYFSGQFGLAVPVVYFISWLEVVGGLALILGVATRVVGLVLGIEMLVATVLVGVGQGVTVELLLALVSFGIALTGSGEYSIYKMECKECGGMLCNGEAGTCTILPHSHE